MRVPTGEELRAARKKRGLTQSDVAERAGVSQPLIARVESEDVDSTLATLHKIVSALNGSESTLDPEEIDLLVPAALRDARQQAGYTQGELAEKADVSQPLISRIEREDVNPRASTLRSLFEHLDIPSTVDEGSDPPTDIPSTDSGVLSQIESEFEDLHRTNSSESPETEESVDKEERCRSCEAPLSGYSDPNFCPNCGAELAN